MYQDSALTFFSQMMTDTEEPRRESPLRPHPDREAQVQRSQSPRRSPPQSGSNSGSNLFITGLNQSVREADLEDLFSKYGHVDKGINFGVVVEDQLKALFKIWKKTSWKKIKFIYTSLPM